ncbi:MAG TPA: hypothetical protein VMV19_03250 [Xanthobacteraceae bacterium]|nr:hypothetical protein [Xanthobacteraceae bacterium]
MKNDHVMSGLKAKRAEIAGKIEMMQREMRLLVATIGHIDATIRTFDPTVDLEDIKSRLPPRFQAFKGEVSRILLDALREAKTPLPVYDLTLTVAASRGITTDDKPFMIILRRRVDACLRNLRKRGTVRSSRPSGSLMLWEIAK